MGTISGALRGGVLASPGSVGQSVEHAVGSLRLLLPDDDRGPDTVTSSIDVLVPTPSMSRATPTMALAPSSSAAFCISAIASPWPLPISSS